LVNTEIDPPRCGGKDGNNGENMIRVGSGKKGWVSQRGVN